MNVFEAFQARIAALIEQRVEAGELPRNLDLSRFVVEPPRDAAHGDLSTNAAMVYAREIKSAGSAPRAFAEALSADLAREPDVAKAEVAGPGFINILLRPEVYEQVLRDILTEGERYGAGQPSRGGRVNVEYVSANPTGPMHVGHARGRPGRRARPIRLPALSRGFGRRHRSHSRWALPGRLPQAGRRGDGPR